MATTKFPAALDGLFVDDLIETTDLPEEVHEEVMTKAPDSYEGDGFPVKKLWPKLTEASRLAIIAALEAEDKANEAEDAAAAAADRIEVWLATIPSAGSRSNYVCHLRKVARMLGAIDENCLNWATVDLGEVVAAVDAAGLKPSYASQVKTAVRGLKAYFEAQS